MHDLRHPAADPAWPHVSLAEAEARLTAPGARFEIEIATIRGQDTRVWKHAPASLRVLAEGLADHGERVLAVLESERISYAATARAVAALAHWLRAVGVGKGDRVALAMRNLPEWPVVFFAATSIGAVVVPLNAWWTADELAFALADCGARVLFADDARCERLRGHLPALDQLQVVVARAAACDMRYHALEALIGRPHDWAALPERRLPEADIAPDDDATIFYTSGTTGEPKGVLGTQRNLCTNILSSGYSTARTLLRRGEVPPDPMPPRTSLLAIPFFHVTGCSAWLVPAVASGSTLVLLHRFDAGEALALIARERIGHAGGVPTIAQALLDHPERERYDLSSLRSVSYGGAPPSADLAARIRDEFGGLPHNGWGMTETTATVTHHGGADYWLRPTSCGPAVPVAELELRDANGVRLSDAGAIGELWVRGPMVAKGYWNRPDETARCFVDGWVRTGDLARIDAEGFCHIVGRIKDVVIRGGENIQAAEVEAVLQAHPAVREAAVTGLPDRLLGEVPAAVVQLAPGMTLEPEALRAWAASRLAPFKLPVAIRCQAGPLPRNAGGKVVKRDLATVFAD